MGHTKRPLDPYPSVSSYGWPMTVGSQQISNSAGELLVRHAGNVEGFEFGSQGLFNMFYASFYADCEHEILPVREGYWLALVYNLIGHGPMRSLTPADNTRSVKKILEAVTAWLQDADGPEKLVMPLEHQYCEQSFSFDKLKGKDCAAADVLRQAAMKVGFQQFRTDL